jgi:hypothetical protein
MQFNFCFDVSDICIAAAMFAFILSGYWFRISSVCLLYLLTMQEMRQRNSGESGPLGPVLICLTIISIRYRFVVWVWAVPAMWTLAFMWTIRCK